MPIASLAEALELVARADEDKFVGRRESQHFEAKGVVGWDLSSAEARYELAKDASAFANATGGVIVVGFRTAKVSSADTDAIATTELMPESGFPALAIQGVLRDCLHPGIRGLRVYWQESAKTATLGFGVIEVPAQLEESLPILIARVAEEGSTLKQIVAGYAKRSGSSSLPHTPAELQRSFREGMNPLARRLSRIEEKVDRLLSRETDLQAAPPTAAQMEELAKQRLKSILEAE